jgi:DNA-binding MarR family transcriptional regulator
MKKPAAAVRREKTAPVARAAKGPGAGPSVPARASHRLAVLAVLEQFRVIFRSTKLHFEWVKEKTGVSGAQLWVLAELHRHPGMRVTELARALAIHQSTASNLLDRLDALGLVHRERSADDQRVVHLSLTAKGRSVIDRAPQPLEGVLPNALHALRGDELAALQGQLERLAARMQVRDRKARRIPLADM